MIFVCDYGLEKARYEFNPLSGRYRHELCLTEKEARHRARGFGTVRRIGLLKREQIFVALYSENDLLKLHIAGVNYELTEKTMSVKRISSFPIAKHFLIAENNHEKLNLKYIFTDLVEDGFKIRDIFTFIVNTTASQQKKYHFIYWWQGIHDGRDIFDKSFQQEALQQSQLRVASEKQANAGRLD